MEEEINTTYSGLLSSEELQQCNDGKEFWFGAKELEERMMKYYEYLDSLDEEYSCGECDLDNDDDPKLDLFSMIKTAVREVMDEATEKPKRPSSKTKKALDDAKVIRENMENLDKQLEE